MIKELENLHYLLGQSYRPARLLRNEVAITSELPFRCSRG